MKIKYIVIAAALLLLLALAACTSTETQTPAAEELAAVECPTAEPCPECPTCPAPPEPVVEVVPNQDDWANSAHNKEDAEAFNHWNEEDPAEIPTNCATCHSSAGYQDFLGADGSDAGVVDAAVPAPAGTIQCETCHNSAAEALTSVTFPSGVTVNDLGGEARCMVCHQGRASKATVDALIEKFAATDPDAVVAPIKEGDTETRFGFVNVHYFPAAATLYGGQAMGGYQYEGKTYDWKNDHVEGYNTCIGCHDQHSLEVKVEQCAECHEGVASTEDLKNVRMIASTSDYDGDGDVLEGMFYEIEGLRSTLYTAIQAYAKEVTGTGIVYDPATYPYFLADADGDGAADKDDTGAAVGFSTWTPRLLEAAYNYQLSIKDPGNHAHGNKYVVQLLFDSTEDLNTKLATPIDMTKMERDDAGHFAGNTMPFRDWDDTGVVPYRCAKCHTATGLPTFIANGGTVVVDGKGTTLPTGIGAMPSSNGFACATCHDGANFPNRYEVKSVVFPSGKTLSYGGKDADGAYIADDANLCITCHQGRESTTSVNNYLAGKDDDTIDPSISFKNIHFLAAGATVFGSDAAGAYQYPKKEYVGLNTHPINKCTDCHDVHKLEPKMEVCAGCHGEKPAEDIRMTEVDYDGDGDTTEGVAGEIETLSTALYAEIQKYAETVSGVPILYDAQSNPYFFVDADKNGEADQDDKGASIRYNAFTPRLMRAAYNYQYSQKDPGAFVHNSKYVVQFLIDSIADLGGSVSGFTRP
jgi:hypothetical protein